MKLVCENLTILPIYFLVKFIENLDKLIYLILLLKGLSLFRIKYDSHFWTSHSCVARVQYGTIIGQQLQNVGRTENSNTILSGLYCCYEISEF
jgi:hypothetical protein